MSAVPNSRFPYSGSTTCTLECFASTLLAIQVPARPISRTDFFFTLDASSVKSPWIRAFTPFDVKESIERLVGLNSTDSRAYSSTTAGAAKPRPRIVTTVRHSNVIAKIVDHRLMSFLLFVTLFCSDLKEDAAGEVGSLWTSS